MSKTNGEASCSGLPSTELVLLNNFLLSTVEFKGPSALVLLTLSSKCLLTLFASKESSFSVAFCVSLQISYCQVFIL